MCFFDNLETTKISSSSCYITRVVLKDVIVGLLTGLVDPDESLETCALRELKEETGYSARVKHVSPGKLLLVSQLLSGLTVCPLLNPPAAAAAAVTLGHTNCLSLSNPLSANCVMPLVISSASY